MMALQDSMSLCADSLECSKQSNPEWRQNVEFGLGMLQIKS